MGMQRTLGKIEQAVDTLTTDSRENIRKVSRLSHIIYAAGVVVLIAVAIFSFTANKLADALIAALKK
jgi:adenylylsulfate kinase-like enzyme